MLRGCLSDLTGRIEPVEFATMKRTPRLADKRGAAVPAARETPRSMLCQHLNLNRLRGLACGRPGLRFVLLALFASGVPLACITGKDYSKATDFVAHDMAGKIDGDDWSYRYAYVDPTIDAPVEDDYVFIFLPYKPKKDCPTEEERKKDRRSIMVSAPKETKAMMLKRGTERTMVFHFEHNGAQFANAAKLGKVKLSAVTGRVIKGRVMGNFNADNWVNGNFSAVVCDYAEMQGKR
jgi:hypothetical protein